MSADQRELRQGGVIEFGSLPAIRSMTGLALHRELRGNVVRILRLLVIAQVTAHAFRAQADEHARGGSAMAGIAGYGRVGAKQRESVQVVFHRIRGDPPASDGMAVLARGSELAAMDVGVTIRALLTYLAEYFTDVTPAACHILVQASQGVLSLGVMVELWFGAYRLPAHAGVAALACHVDRSMGISSPLRPSWLRTHQSRDAKEQYRQ
jgi:hypothetical protein